MKNNTNNYNKESGKGIIFGVLGILTLIIAIMGASLAYFTASASAADEDIQVTSATVTITYLQGDILTANELIPSEYDVVRRTYYRTETDDEGNSLQCKDAKGYQVCSVFRFKASNEAGRTAQAITGTITTKTPEETIAEQQGREFQNLKFAVFKIPHDENGNPIEDAYGEITREEIGNYTCHADESKLKPTTDPNPVAQLFNHCTGAEADEETGADEDHIVRLEAGEVGEFEIVIWLDETKGPQDEQGLSYTGQVQIGVSGASSEEITGQYP